MGGACIAWAGPVALAGAVWAAAPPLRATGVTPTYCVQDVDAVAFTVENVTSREQWFNLSVEKRDAGGAWQGYWDDLFGSEPHPLKANAFRLAGGASRTFAWRVRLLGVNVLLGVGHYRIVAIVVEEDVKAPATNHVMATFSVDRESCTGGTP